MSHNEKPAAQHAESGAPVADERAAFEAMFSGIHPAAKIPAAHLFERVVSDSRYCSLEVEYAWQTYRAALASRPAAENMVLGKQPEIATETAETRMDTGFHDAGQIASRPAEVDDWISVDDRLPELQKEVLICCGYLVLGYRTDDKHDPENHNGWVIDFDNGSASAITHWRPLPAAPSHTTNKEK